jgi:hypothetical protein
MLAHALNTIVGLCLTYAAIFPTAVGIGRDRFALTGAILTIVLALWARRSDASTWQSTTAVTAGVLLAILAIANRVIQVSDVLMFWGVLWAGLVSATVCLWAALYRPPQSASAAE